MGTIAGLTAGAVDCYMVCCAQVRVVGKAHPSGNRGALGTAAASRTTRRGHTGAPPGLLGLALAAITTEHSDQHTKAEKRYVDWRTASAASAPSAGKSSWRAPSWLRAVAEDAARPSRVSHTVAQ